MNHLAYILPSYALAVLVPGALGLEAWLRLRAARRKLRAVDPRGRA